MLIAGLQGSDAAAGLMPAWRSLQLTPLARIAHVIAHVSNTISPTCNCSVSTIAQVCSIV